MAIGSNISAHRAAGLGISVTMDPSPLLLVAQFDKLGLDIRSFKEPLHRAIRDVVAPSLQQNFLSQGRPEVWPELAEGTYQRKKALGFTAVANFPLLRTTKLFKKAGQQNIWKIDGLDGTAVLNLPDDVWYGKLHQEGVGSAYDGEYRRRNRRTGQMQIIKFGTPGNVPQRIWAILQDEDIDKIEKVFAKWLRERVKAAGFR